MPSSPSAQAATTVADELKTCDKPTLPEVIESIGCGPAQLRFCLTGGGVYLADGSELLLISAVTQSLAVDWSLTPVERGLVVTIVFVGVLVGNVTCGPLGDRYGRRRLIITSYLGVFIFSILSSLVESYRTLCFFRLLVGFSFGIGQPAWNTLATEVTPRFWRIPMQGLSQLLFVAGEIYSALLILLDDPAMQHLHWRKLLRLGAIPSACFALASFGFLLPSPSFLALKGEYEAARSVLDTMKRDNLVGDSVSTDFRVAPVTRLSRHEFGYQLKGVFGRHLLSSTLITMLTCFGLNLVYYGCLYAFPQVLPSVHSMEGTAGVQLIAGALWEIPGNIAGILFGMSLPRKPVIKLSLGFSAISLLMFVIGITSSPSSLSHTLYHSGYYGIKAVGAAGFIIVYQYAGEIYPTETRTTGVAICLGSGRVGAMLAPLFVEWIHAKTHSFSGFFYTIFLFCVLNAFLIDFLPFETSDMLLSDHLVQDDESHDDTRSSRSVRSARSVSVRDGHCVRKLLPADSSGNNSCDVSVKSESNRDDDAQVSDALDEECMTSP